MVVVVVVKEATTGLVFGTSRESEQGRPPETRQLYVHVL
jgi:hypothetical protein